MRSGSCLQTRTPVSPIFMIAPVAPGEGGEDVHVPEDVPPPPAPHAVARQAKPLPEVREPTADEVARHALTHLPYRRWCRWCVRARMANLPHRALPPFSRTTPLFVLDDAFIKHANGEKVLSILVGRPYPSRALFAVPCSPKARTNMLPSGWQHFSEHVEWSPSLT